MSHRAWSDRLSAYLDGELTLPERAATERHLAECTECAAVLEELNDVILAAGRLPALPPEQDLWPGIEARIRQSAVPLRVATGGSASVGRRRFRAPGLAAAAVALFALATTSFWIGRATAPASPALVQGAADPDQVSRQEPDASTENLIAELERAFADNRARFDLATVQLIEANLAIIDRAVAEAKDALAREPSSTYLNRHLASTLLQKVRLLRNVNEIAATFE